MKEKKTSVVGIIGLIFAILGLLLSAVPIVNNFAFVLAIIGLILAVAALLSAKKKGAGKGIGIAALVISLAAGGIVLASQTFYGKALDEIGDEIGDSLDRASGEKTEEILGEEVDVNVGKLKVKTDEYGFSETAVAVNVTNRLDEKKSYSVHLEIVDKDGKRIKDDTIYASDLGANQSQDFKAFEYIEDSDLEAAKAGEVKIVSVSQM